MKIVTFLKLHRVIDKAETHRLFERTDTPSERRMQWRSSLSEVASPASIIDILIHVRPSEIRSESDVGGHCGTFNRPVERRVVSYSAGAGCDATSRAIVQRRERAWHQAIQAP